MDSAIKSLLLLLLLLLLDVPHGSSQRYFSHVIRYQDIMQQFLFHSSQPILHSF
jgi:hypothetical protein